MIKIVFAEPSNDDWHKWRERCNRATDKLIEERSRGVISEINGALYREMRTVYLSQDGSFYGKCAYCESFIYGDQPGDIDHFRPKSEVRDLNSKLVTAANQQGDRSPHPGYYWLAYDWRNLLPSCRDCNSPTKWKTKEKLVGKGTRFPVKGAHAVSPGKETEEQPLLINPTADEEPSKHLEVDYLGILISKTDRGEACKEVFGLNDREALVRMRKQAFDDASEAVVALFDAARAKETDRIERSLRRLSAFEEGRAAYSAAGRAGMASKLPQFHAIAAWLSEEYEKLRNAKCFGEKVIGSGQFIICASCKEAVPDSYVKRLREKGTMVFNCPCGGTVSLAEQ